MGRASRQIGTPAGDDDDDEDDDEDELIATPEITFGLFFLKSQKQARGDEGVVEKGNRHHWI